jgi:hypothetical protein
MLWGFSPYQLLFQRIAKPAWRTIRQTLLSRAGILSVVGLSGQLQPHFPGPATFPLHNKQVELS